MTWIHIHIISNFNFPLSHSKMQKLCLRRVCNKTFEGGYLGKLRSCGHGRHPVGFFKQPYTLFDFPSVRQAVMLDVYRGVWNTVWDLHMLSRTKLDAIICFLTREGRGLQWPILQSIANETPGTLISTSHLCFPIVLGLPIHSLEMWARVSHGLC